MVQFFLLNKTNNFNPVIPFFYQKDFPKSRSDTGSGSAVFRIWTTHADTNVLHKQVNFTRQIETSTKAKQNKFLKYLNIFIKYVIYISCPAVKRGVKSQIKSLQLDNALAGGKYSKVWCPLLL